MEYDPAQRRLQIGKGYIGNVPPEVWAYEVSGMNLLRQRFGYRGRDRSRPIIGDRRLPSPLSEIQPGHWPHEYTSDLIDLLNVLGRLVPLEPKQAELLEAILAGKLIDRAELEAEGAFASTPSHRCTRHLKTCKFACASAHIASDSLLIRPKGKSTWKKRSSTIFSQTGLRATCSGRRHV